MSGVINIAKNNAERRLSYTSTSIPGITKLISKFKIKKDTNKYTKYKTIFKIRPPFSTNFITSPIKILNTLFVI